jgi:hypothetical protein
VRVSSCCALRASGQQPASAPPFSARCRAMRFHVRGVDHLCVCGSSVSSKLPEQVFPDATPRPAHKAIIDRCRRSILGRAIAPATAAFQNMHDAADDAAVVRPLDAPYIRRQMRLDPSPLLIAQPKQVPAHNPDPLPKTNQDRIVRAKKLMSSDPSKPALFSDPTRFFMPIEITSRGSSGDAKGGTTRSDHRNLGLAGRHQFLVG